MASVTGPCQKKCVEPVCMKTFLFHAHSCRGEMQTTYGPIENFDVARMVLLVLFGHPVLSPSARWFAHLMSNGDFITKVSNECKNVVTALQCEKTKVLSFGSWRREKTTMLTLNEYPFASYVPNKALAACFAAIVGISLSLWLVHSYQNRFRPPRICFLLGVSHLTIFTELILRATLDPLKQDSKTIFIVLSTLFVTGQRMIIVGNFAFLLAHMPRCKKSRFLLIGVVLSVVTSGVLMSPATMLSFDRNQINTSYIFRILSASILLTVTIIFYVVWFYSRTWNDMSQSAKLLISVSSFACFVAALFTLIQSFPNTYEKLNADESWFYAFQMTPIIVAHCFWSIFHPKRTLDFQPSSPPPLTTNIE